MEPKTLDDAKIGALVQLATIAQQQGTLKDLVEKLQAAADENPTDVHTHKTLARLYNLMQRNDKADTVIDKLIDITPHDTAYRYLRLQRILNENLTPDKFKEKIAELPVMTPEDQWQAIAQYAESLLHKGDTATANKLLHEIQNKKISNLDTVSAFVNAFVLPKKTDIAQKHLMAFTPPTQNSHDYKSLCQHLIDTYLHQDKPEKALDVLWGFIEKTKPTSVNTQHIASHTQSLLTSRYRSIPTKFPPYSAYFNAERIDFLEHNFRQFQIHTYTQTYNTEPGSSRHNEETYGHTLQPFKKLQNVLDTAESNNRIYPSLALAYCYWWYGKRQNAKDTVIAIQNEFPDDLILKLNLALLYMQTGNISEARNILEKLAQVPTHQQQQYYALMLELATRSRDTDALEVLMPKILNASYNAEDLYQFSQTLDENGSTHHAITLARKAASFAMTQRNTSLLIDLADHLNSLGSAQASTALYKRAFKFKNTPSRQNNESKRIQNAQNKPNSFQAQRTLAVHYEQTHQIEKAITAYKAALALRPKDNNTRLQYVRMLERNGKATAAISDYTALLKSDPSTLDYQHDTAIDAFIATEKIDELIALTHNIIMPVGNYAGNNFALSVARRCFTENRTAAAIQLFEKIINIHPRWKALHTELASIYVNTGHPEKAVQFLTEKQKSKKPLLSDTEFITKIAEIYHGSGNTEKAINYLKEKINEHTQPKSITPLVLKLADLYKHNNASHKLIAEYETKLAQNPTDTHLPYIITAMKLKAHDTHGINALTDKVIEKANTSITIQELYDLSDACGDNGLHTLQCRLLEAAVQKLPKEKGFQKLAAAYLKKGDISKAHIAIRKMGKLKAMSTGWGSILDKRKLATTYMQYHMWDEALTIYAEIVNSWEASYWQRNDAHTKMLEIKQQRGDLDVLTDTEIQGMPIDLQHAYAEKFEDIGKVDKAIQIYNRLMKNIPEAYDTRKYLAHLYTRIGQHSTAQQIWTALLKVDPENTIYQDGLVHSLHAADQQTDAYTLAQQYIQAAPDIYKHYLRLAKLYADDNKTDDAIVNYEKAIALAPENTKAYLDVAHIYLRTDNFAKAENALNTALQYMTSSYQKENIENQIRNLYRYQGKLTEWFKDAEAKGPFTADMQAQKARHLLNIGNTEKAVEAFKKAIDMTTDSYEKNWLSNKLLTVYVQHDQNEEAMDLYKKIVYRSDSSRSISYGPKSITVSSSAIQAQDTLIRTYKNENKLADIFQKFSQLNGFQGSFGFCS